MIRDVVRYKPPSCWGVLCIDIWEDQANTDFYTNAMDRLSAYNIVGVVNATTDLTLDYNDRSIFNTLKNYHWAGDTINTQINDRVLLDLIKCAGHQRTAKVIHDHLFDGNTVHLSSKETFIHHGHYYWPEIKDWIILGSAWKYCLHRGPLGIDKLVDIPGHQFHIFPEWSIQDQHKLPPTTQNIHDDFFVWSTIDDGGFRLITRANNHKWVEEQWNSSQTI